MVVVFVVQEKYNLPPVNRETKKTGAHTKGDEPSNANAEERVNVTHNLLEYSHRGGRPNIAARFPFDTRTSTVNKVVGGAGFCHSSVPSKGGSRMCISSATPKKCPSLSEIISLVYLAIS